MAPFSGALTDPLDDFLRAALLIATGAYEVEFRFDGEPDPWWMWRLRQDVLAHPVRGELKVKISRWDLPPEGSPEASPEVAFEAICDPDLFAFAVVSAARSLLDKHGPDGFLAQWGGPFPTRALVAIEAALSIKQATPLAVDPRVWK
jgi:hypothetical protein